MKMCYITPPLQRGSCYDKPNLSHTKPPYLPDLNPCGLYFFQGLKNGLIFRSFSFLSNSIASKQQFQQPSQIGFHRFFDQRKYSCRVGVCVQKGSIVSDWFRFCVYHAVYRLCPSCRTFCHSNLHTSIKQYSEFWLWVKKEKSNESCVINP